MHYHCWLVKYAVVRNLSWPFPPASLYFNHADLNIEEASKKQIIVKMSGWSLLLSGTPESPHLPYMPCPGLSATCTHIETEEPGHVLSFLFQKSQYYN